MTLEEKIENALLSYKHTVKIQKREFDESKTYIQMTMITLPNLKESYRVRHIHIAISKYSPIHWQISSDYTFHRIAVSTLVTEHDECLDNKIHTLLDEIKKLL